MSGIVTFCSNAGDLVVIDLALNNFQFKQSKRDNNLSFDENIMLETLWLELLKNELPALQKQYPNAMIGISMEFIHSCQNNSAFLNFSANIPDVSKVFFYHILPNCDFQARMQSDLEDGGIHPEFDEKAGVLYLKKPVRVDGGALVNQCEQVILSRLEETVKKITSIQDPPDLLASSSVYVDHYVDIKRLFMKPDELSLVVYYLSRRLLTLGKEYDALVATSKNGAILATLLGRMIDRDVVCCVNIGPQYALSASAVEQIQSGKRYVYVYDFICLGTEAKLLHALVTSRRATLVGGIGVASYIPLDNPDLLLKHSPLSDLDCLVNLISAKITYHTYMQKDDTNQLVDPRSPQRSHIKRRK